jgi:hypothetical protein
MKQLSPDIPELSLGAITRFGEHELRRGIFCLKKYIVRPDGQRADKPFDVVEFLNAYVNAGGALFLNLLAAAGGTAFNNANAYIGVGDSSTATTAPMTDIQASTNKLRKAMDATFPSLSGQIMTWRSTFGSSDANFAWQEVALFNASTSGTMLSRGVSSLGTKASGTSWVMSYTITIP